MLNENQLYNNKLKFLELLGKLNIDLTSLVKYLDANDYFNKPASSQYFRPYAGGLCQYALDLYYELAQLVNAYCPGKYTEEDVIKVALFKDIYKAELFEAYTKNVLTPEEEREEIKKVFFSILDENYCGRFKLSLLLSLLKMDKLSRKMFPR